MKRLRSFLVFFIPFIMFFFYFTSNYEHNPTSANHKHENVEIPEGYKIPSLNISVTKDMSGTWLLKVDTSDFTFAPNKVGSNDPSYNEGHAHIYVNGKKINRLYGPYYNLDTLQKGENEIMVTLNSNNHGVLSYKGQPIISRIVVDNQK